MHSSNVMFKGWCRIDFKIAHFFWEPAVISNLKYLPNLIPLAFVKETPPSLNEIFKLWTKTLSRLDVEQIKEMRWTVYWRYQFSVQCWLPGMIC